MICLHKIYIPYICNWDDMCISSVTTKTTITSNNRWAKAEEMKMLHNWWATPHIGSMVEQISRTKLVLIINDVVCIASIVMSIEFRVFIIFILLKHKLHPTRVKFEKNNHTQLLDLTGWSGVVVVVRSQWHANIFHYNLLSIVRPRTVACYTINWTAGWVRFRMNAQLIQ